MTYVKKQGRPYGGTRLITKKEHSILKKYGVKRTFFICHSLLGGLILFKRDKRKKLSIYLSEILDSEQYLKALEELTNFWEEK